MEQLLAAGRRSDRGSIAALAKRIEAQLVDLRERLLADRDRAAARAEVERLTADLSAAKARAAGQTGEPLPCPDCDFSSPSPQGVGVHRARKHGFRAQGRPPTTA